MEKTIDCSCLQKYEKNTNICIISYTPKEKQKDAFLKEALQNCGFNVSFAGDFNGLIKQYFNIWYPFSRYTLLKFLKKTILFLFVSMFRKRNNSKNTLYLLVNYGVNYQWLHEVAQVKLREIGATDRLYFYDVKNNRIIKYKKPVLGYMEYHVAWHCNLKCKGCSHYCNLYDKPFFGNLDKYRKNLLRLRELFDNIERIRLLGGEPFLNPRIGDYVKITREIFPNTDLRIVSNGLLIPSLNHDVLEIIRKHKVKLDITIYPPTAKVIDKIQQVLTNAGISFYPEKMKNEFRYTVGSKKTNQGNKTYSYCSNKKCHFLHDDGRMSACGIPIYYQEAKDRLKTKREVTDSDWIDLYKVTDGYEVLSSFNKPIPFCEYCIDSRKNACFSWQGNYTKEINENDIRKI